MKLFDVVCLTGLSACILSGCSPAPSKSADAGKKGGVKIGKPEKKSLRRVVEQPAAVEAFEETPLVARIPGHVEKVNVDIGQEVKRGAVLAELFVPEMIKELAQKDALVLQAKAELEQARASLGAAEAQILTAKAQVREADAGHERWKSEYQRVDKLVVDKVVDKQIRDETLYQRNAAEAKALSARALVTESEAKRDKAKADVSAADARVKVASADHGRFKALVDYREIVAPYDCIVTRRYIHTGHFLHPTGNASGVIFNVARTDKLRIIAEIPESEAIHVKNDLVVKIQAPVYKLPPVEGKVARTSWTLDPRSRTLRMEIDHPSKDSVFRPGMFVNVTFNVDFKDRITLPASAIFTHNDLPCCWRVVDGKAVRTALKLGVREGASVEVLQMQVRESTWENVTGNEDVVLTNLGAITEGKEVPGQK